MNLAGSTQEVLFKLIETGVFGSAERLAKMSGTRWQMQSVSVKMGWLGKPAFPIEDDDHYGSYFSMPGGFFLVIFSRKSGAKVADVFLSRNCKPTESAVEREQMALAEISNVMVNAVVGVLADACETAVFISAPETLRGTKEGLVEQALERFNTSKDDFVISTSVHMSSSALASDCTVVFLLDSRLMGRLVNALES